MLEQKKLNLIWAVFDSQGFGQGAQPKLTGAQFRYPISANRCFVKADSSSANVYDQRYQNVARDGSRPVTTVYVNKVLRHGSRFFITLIYFVSPISCKSTNFFSFEWVWLAQTTSESEYSYCYFSRRKPLAWSLVLCTSIFHQIVLVPTIQCKLILVAGNHTRDNRTYW